MKRAPGHARLARFHQTKAEPEQTVGLGDDHPAVVEGRTLFPNRVAPTVGSQRFLVSGVNNAKIGKAVEKGPWAGMPVFTLTLEERATCPRSCEVWNECYGNALQWPNRWDHTDPAFLPTLQAELITMGRQNPKGFVVRLHVLGDFYSVAYVYFWAEMLAAVPSLRVYGYTARTIVDDDPESAKIARAIDVLTTNIWERFAVRTSSSQEVAFSRAIVVETPEEAEAKDAILCPAQVEKTQTCGTCALCWSPNARDKTIAFLRHGMKRATGPRAIKAPPQPPPEPAPLKRRDAGRLAVATAYVPLPQRIAAQIEAAAPELFVRFPAGVLIADVMAVTGTTYNQTTVALADLHRAGRVAWVRASSTDKHKVMRPADQSETEEALTAHQQAVLDLLTRKAIKGVVEIDRSALRAASGLSMPTLDMCVSALRRKGFTEHAGARAGNALFRLLKPSAAPIASIPGVLAPKSPPSVAVSRLAPSEPQRPVAPSPVKATDKPQAALWEPVEQARPRLAAPIPQPAPAVPVVGIPTLAPVTPDADEPIAGAPPNSLLSLGYRACKWPTNDPPLGRGDLMRFCCRQTEEGATYCATHAAKARAGVGRVWTEEQKTAFAAKTRARIAGAATRKAAEARA